MPHAFPRLAFRPPGYSERGRPPRWSLLLCLSLLVSGLPGCRPGPEPRTQAPPSAARDEARRQQQQAGQQCRQRRGQLLEGLAELRRAEAALAQVRAAAPPPLPAPPVWDEAREERFSQVDQELDRQRYERELMTWQQSRLDRQAVLARQRQRQAVAQQRLDRQAVLLRQRHPGLFTGPASIEVEPRELERLSRCPADPA